MEWIKVIHEMYKQKPRRQQQLNAQEGLDRKLSRMLVPDTRDDPSYAIHPHEGCPLAVLQVFLIERQVNREEFSNIKTADDVKQSLDKYDKWHDAVVYAVYRENPCDNLRKLLVSRESGILESDTGS